MCARLLTGLPDLGPLQAQLDAETAARIAADLGLPADLDAEAGIRAAGDNRLQLSVDAEAAARAGADNALQLDLADEATTRGAADASLVSAVTAQFPSTTGLGGPTSRRWAMTHASPASLSVSRSMASAPASARSASRRMGTRSLVRPARPLHEGSNLVNVTYSGFSGCLNIRGGGATLGLQTSNGAEAFLVGYDAPVLDDNANRRTMSFHPPN